MMGLIKSKYFFVVILAVIIGLAVGMIIGYYTSPFGIFECFKKLNYQNVTCVQEGKDLHCTMTDGRGYRIENVVR